MERHLRALIVEDNPADANLIHEMLNQSRDLSLSLEQASRLSHGLERLKANQLDLVLLDLSLPDSRGFETFAKAHAHAPDLPIIVLTGLDDRSLAVKAVREGAQDYLVKGQVSGDLLSRSIRYAVERKGAEQALRASEERYRQLVENATDVIYSHDLVGNITSANPAGGRIFGYAAEDLEHLTIWDLVDPDYVAETEQMIQDQLEGVARAGPYEILARNKSGSPVWVEVNPRLVQRPGASPEIQGVARDVTERKEMEEQLRRQERLAALGQLAAGVAHDFRNLLTTVILYAELSRRHARLPDELDQNMKVIIDESHRATDLVQQILDFSSNAMIEPRPLDVKAFVRSTLKVLRRAIPEDIELALETEPGPQRVRADAGRLKQALTNLALNARDAMPEGGELRFSISSRRGEEEPAMETHRRGLSQGSTLPAGEWVSIAVSDTGTGMTEEVQEHLFEPFFTTKEVGEGTGLGLAQVYGIVRQHDGYVHVETAPGEGSTFFIHLPVCREEPVPPAPRSKEAPVARGETILLVEDEPRLRQAGKSVLESLGYQVLTAANGREALVLCGLEKPAADGEVPPSLGDKGAPLPSANAPVAIDLIITDLVMPEMGGRALATELSRRAPDVRRIAITGYALDKQDKEALREAGFQALVRKPFERSQLARAIRQALDR